jgi:NAD(P)-dependent dehydrogenase (short-subunit alcohol dehydrogenase family)
MDIRGRGIVVTGASRGLGEALSRWFAERGGRVAMVARGGEDLHRAARRIVEAGGIAHPIEADVSDKNAIYAIAGTAAALVGPIDIVVQNASTLGPVPMPLLLDTACEDLSSVLETNVVGPFRLTKALAGSMVLRGHGVVVFVSSDAAVNGYPHWGAYGVSKAALDQMARVWGAELEGSGVRIFSVDPGEMNTKMHADAVPDADPSTLLDPAVVAARIGALVEHNHRILNGTRLEAAAPLAESHA